MPRTNRTPRLLSEQELHDWVQNPSPVDPERATELAALNMRIAAAVTDRGLRRSINQLLGLETDESIQREDRMMLTVGTLCLANGQSALWSAIWRAVYDWNDWSDEDEFVWLERATQRARRRKL